MLFRPKTLLDKTYLLGIVIKGFDGVVETASGVLLLLVSPSAFDHLARTLTRRELASDPNDFVANHILHYGHQLATGHTGLAVLFLLSHGLVKVGLVTALLLQKLWAYPWALVLLTLFLVYQVYLLATQASIWMAILTVLDIVIIFLVWREWQKVRATPEEEAK